MTKPHKHPVGLWMISTSASFFCVCFGMISSLLALYLSNVLHMKSSDVYSLFAAFFALIFALPVVGGYLGNHFGYKKALILANLLLIAGLLFLAIPTFTFMYLGLAFFASGTAIYTPTYLTLQGKLYEKSDARRDSAYTYSYVVTNVGFLIASVLGGFLQQHFNFQICFLVGAVIGVIPLILFMIWIRTLEFPSESSIAPRSKMGHSGTWLGLILSTALLI
ncbi:MAG: MFS transporter, partial [Gammaproteobacteria bacterium]|nr:MFS transporter [Gammaproteobacteria bacterium]